MRVLLIFIALAVIAMVIRQLWLRPRADRQQRRQLSGQMVQCKHCGMYLPENEAIRSREQWYCSKEHRDADHRGDAGEQP